MKTTLCCLLLASAFASTLATFVIGTGTATSSTGTAFVLSANQAAWGVAALAGLAVAKGLLFAAYMHDRANGVNHAKNYARGVKRLRGKREAPLVDFAPMFEAIDQQDTDDCGKLLVCHSFA